MTSRPGIVQRGEQGKGERRIVIMKNIKVIIVKIEIMMMMMTEIMMIVMMMERTL